MKKIIFAKNIYTEDKIIQNGAISIENKIISNIFETRQNLTPDYNFDTLDLYPGLIDIHIHGGYGYDIMNGANDVTSLSKELIKSGVTAFCPTLITSDFDDMKTLLNNIMDINQNDCFSEILNIFLEGPYISNEYRGTHENNYIRNLDLIEVENLLKNYSKTIGRIAIAPEKENTLAAIKLLNKYNIKASIGHSGADSFQTEQAINAGANIAIHTFNTMKNFNHRNSGILGTVLTDDRIYCEIIADLIHTDITALKLLLKCKQKNKIILVSDCLSAGGLSDGEYTLGNTTVYVKDGIARNKNGILAGSTLKLTDGIKNIVKAGADFHSAINMASINPAKAIGFDKSIGSIKRGKYANFFIGDENLHIKYVFKNGMPVYKV